MKTQVHTSSKRISTSKCDICNYYFLETFWEFFGNFFGIFLEDFFGGFFFDGIFLVEFLGRNFLGGFFWEDFFRGFFGEDFLGRNSTKSYYNIEGIDLFVNILVFVKILYLRKGRKEGKFKSLEVRLQVHRT